MRHILVVAHQTLEGPHLLEEVGRRMKSGDCRVHVVVPVHHPMGAFSEASIQAGAQAVLDDGLRRIRDLDRSGSVDVTGEVGDANPTYAVEVVRNRGQQIDEVLVSTFAKGRSRWLQGNVPKKIRALLPGIEVVHLVGDAEPART
jgi:hypothetical protein